MRRLVGYVILAAVVAGAGYGLYAYVLRAAPAPPPPARPVELKPQTAMPVMRAFSLELPFVGQVQSWTRVDVEALADGRIEKVAAADEAPVKAGQTLFTLGGGRVAARLRELHDQVDALKRRRTLAQQVVAGKQESGELKLVPQAQVAAARQALESAKADLALAQRRLEVLQEATTVKAPASGTFTGRRVSAGEAVSAGEVLAQVIDPAHLRVEAHVNAPAGVALAGLKARVRLSDMNGLSGSVTHVLPSADADGAAVVWIEGPEIDAGLRAGQSAGGTLAAETRRAWGVPQSAVVYDEREAPLVFVEQGGEFKRTPVRVGVTSGGWVEVLSGLDGKLPVATSGAYELYYRTFSQTYKAPD